MSRRVIHGFHFIRLDPGQSPSPGSWWPSTDRAHVRFHSMCECGAAMDHLEERVVSTLGAVHGFRCGDHQHEAAVLDGWHPPDHEMVFAEPQHPVIREIIHRPCGAANDVGPDAAGAMARDPRNFRGHWCTKCQRHGYNHEFEFPDGSEVGRGWFGRVRYDAMSEKLLAEIGPVYGYPWPYPK